MKRQRVIFDNVDSERDLGLFLFNISIGSPAVRTSFVDIPGADGALDLTEALGAVNYSTRTLVFSLGRQLTDRYQQDAAVKNALHGRRMPIRLSGDPEHYFLGRISVGEFIKNGGLGQVDITCICDPWRYRLQPTSVSGTVPNSGTLTLTLPNEARPVVPTIEVSAAATLQFGGNTISVGAGSHRELDIQLTAGDNELTVTAAVGTTVTVTYREASL